MRWALILLCIGCSRDPLSDGTDLGRGSIDDLAAERDFAGSLDLAMVEAPDLAPALDLRVCPRYSLGEEPIWVIRLLDGEANLRYGAAIRVAGDVSVTFSGVPACSVPADLAVTVQPGNATDGVQLLARGWRRPGVFLECDIVGGHDFVAALGVEDGLSSPTVVVRDAAKGSKTQLSFHVARPLQGIDCNAAVALGQPCQADCQCRNGLAASRCIPTSPQSGICALSCSEDLDCPVAVPYCTPAGNPPYTCQAAKPPMCPSCLLGRRCSVDNRCVPVAQPLSQPCMCHSDCPTSMCIDPGECRIPCTTIIDCPAGAMACTNGRCL